MNNTDTLRHRAWLMRAMRPGAPATEALIATDGLRATVEQIRAQQAPPAVLEEVVQLDPEVDGDLAAIERGHVRLLTPESAEWPSASLGVLTASGVGAPLGLWVYGSSSLAAHVRQTPLVALVGPHAARAYGEYVASGWAQHLAEHGVGVVTGVQLGLERAALIGAAAGARPPVVLGRRPMEEMLASETLAPLLHAIVERGGLVVSASPIRTRTCPERRVRQAAILAALTRATVLVESHTTATLPSQHVAWAQRLRRPLIAVPGPIASNISAATSELVAGGTAGLASHAEQVVAAIQST